MLIEGFDILEKLGESALTEVWRAYQHSLNRAVKIKTLRPEFSDCADEVKLFVEEARRTARLRHHHIEAIYDVGRQGDLYYSIMEFVDGPSAADLIGQGGPLIPQTALQMALAAARALAYAWDGYRLVHRNVRPDCLRVDRDGTVKLGYLGMSLRVDPLNPDLRLEPGSTAGVPHYMAPEQADEHPLIDFRTDMYGLGCTLYHMCTGLLPFGDHDRETVLERQRSGSLKHPRLVNPDVPSGAAYVLEKLLMKNPADRFPSWPRAVEALEKAAGGHVFLRKGEVRPPCTLGAADEPPPSRKKQTKTRRARRLQVRKGSVSGSAAAATRLPH